MLKYFTFELILNATPQIIDKSSSITNNSPTVVKIIDLSILQIFLMQTHALVYALEMSKKLLLG